jgi:hypothetical protein
VDYYDMQDTLYSRRVKILTWANREEIAACTLPKGGYLDIKFEFAVYDLNFKFLTFQLLLNQSLESLVLPLTLLDVCHVAPTDMRHLQQYALRGSILTAQPFRLRPEGLPEFLGGLRLPELSARKEQSSLLGQCSI